MKSLSTILDDRELRFDGVSIVDSEEELCQAILLGVPPAKLKAKTSFEELQVFNSLVVDDDKIQADTDEPISLSFHWKLPHDFLVLNIHEFIAKEFEARFIGNYSDDYINSAIERIAAELEEIESRGMVDFFRTIIFVLSTFQKTQSVWGVGRGSSCACYILFVLGLHSVDCIKYNVPMTEFFHD